MKSRTTGYRIMIGNALPFKNAAGELLHGLRAEEKSPTIILSQEAADAFHKHKCGFDLNPGEYNLLNLAFDQAQLPRLS